MIKSFRKLGIEGNFLNIINIVHEKPVLILHPAVKDQKLHPRDWQDRDAHFQPCYPPRAGRSSRSSWNRSGNKGIPTLKEEIKSSLFADGIMLQTENPREATRELLKLIKEFSKAAGCKTNIHEPAATLHTRKEQAEGEVREVPAPQ